METTRDTILEVARALYAEHGAQGLSMRAVASQCGITAAAIYRHFASKEALILAVCEQAWRTFEAHLYGGLRGHDALSRLWLTGQGYRDFALTHEPYYRALFMRPHPQFTQLADTAQATFSPTFRFLVDRLAECVRQGGLDPQHDPEALAVQIWSQCHGLAALQLDGHLKLDAAQFRALFDATLSRVLLGLGAPRDPAT